jgi:hypothetical protein
MVVGDRQPWEPWAFVSSLAGSDPPGSSVHLVEGSGGGLKEVGQRLCWLGSSGTRGSLMAQMMAAKRFRPGLRRMKKRLPRAAA